MTTTMAATIRDYNPVADTATVELSQLSGDDLWIDGLTIVTGINRNLLSYGAVVTLALPDAHRVCEAVVTSVTTPGATADTVAGVLQKTETGRSLLFTDAVGSGSATVTYPFPFSALPAVILTGDRGLPFTLSAISTTGFVASLAGATPDTFVGFTWTASGAA